VERTLFMLAGKPGPRRHRMVEPDPPDGWEHIAFSGDFLWERASVVPPERRALNVGRGTRHGA